jgi:hypothetical protein
MRPVPVSKEELLGKVRANRVRHDGIYTEAIAAYRAKAAEWHQGQAEAANHGRQLERCLPGSIPEPEDHTGDYDAAIQMIEMAQATEIMVDEETFRRLVLDEWGWSDRWARTTSVYAAS